MSSITPHTAWQEVYAKSIGLCAAFATNNASVMLVDRQQAIRNCTTGWHQAAQHCLQCSVKHLGEGLRRRGGGEGLRLLRLALGLGLRRLDLS